MTKHSPLTSHDERRAFDPSSPNDAPSKSQGSSWWFGLVALLPIACCALPAFLAAGITVSTGVLVGGAAGAVIILVGVLFAVAVVRRRRRAAGEQDKCC